jgi:uncharacterized Zn-binding protein involved in type VI secretion
MPGPVCRVGDKNDAGGAILPPSPEEILAGGATVLINNRPAAFFGSKVSPHPDSHAGQSCTSKNKTVLVNRKPIVTVGDIDTCGHKRIQGSRDVVVGS